ncbi:type VI secretion system baseplate subunit TssE [Sphingomonas jatrophae]|uniref:Type VI secretion system protein ImpF n=1 Tax=Sphingomonas jatrophae TaxID=1166337 RepID=A0A1I6M207_9SPHN|nr:type VI secretion system baseplate subunit TssE [Sphingomonas jatrophae]SFS09703.1 type VI secretion system protein ImpF [Sphingomonas jatrophae]
MTAGSLLDRTSLDEGQQTSLAAQRESLRRDIEAMLNSRRHLFSWPAWFEELDRSLLAYGLDDLTNESLASTDFRARFVEEAERQLRRLEPRLGRFEVMVLPNRDELDATLRFRVTGTVTLGSVREELHFDSHVDPVRAQLVIGA